MLVPSLDWVSDLCIREQSARVAVKSEWGPHGVRDGPTVKLRRANLTAANNGEINYLVRNILNKAIKLLIRYTCQYLLQSRLKYCRLLL